MLEVFERQIRPAGQGSHDVRSGAPLHCENVPSGHASQLILLALAVARLPLVPAVEAVPYDSLKVPAVQSVGVVVPVAVQLKPGGQGRQ